MSIWTRVRVKGEGGHSWGGGRPGRVPGGWHTSGKLPRSGRPSLSLPPKLPPATDTHILPHPPTCTPPHILALPLTPGTPIGMLALSHTHILPQIQLAQVFQPGQSRSGQCAANEITRQEYIPHRSQPSQRLNPSVVPGAVGLPADCLPKSGRAQPCAATAATAATAEFERVAAPSRERAGEPRPAPAPTTVAARAGRGGAVVGGTKAESGGEGPLEGRVLWCVREKSEEG